MQISQGRAGIARRQVAWVVFVLMPGALAYFAPEASAYPSRRLSDKPVFLNSSSSTRTVLVWDAVQYGQRGSFLLLRGSETEGLRVAAKLPVVEGSHRYRYVDEGLPLDVETVYQLVYRNDHGTQFVLVTARVERHGVRSSGVVPSPTRDTDPGRGADPQLQAPSPPLAWLSNWAEHESGEWPEPLNPPPKRPALG